MQMYTPTIATLLCGVLMLSGCDAHTTPAAAEYPPATQPSQADDAAALQVVFDDMLSTDNGNSPSEWRRDQSEPVYFSKHAPERRLDASEVLSLSEDKKLKALTAGQRTAAADAADDLIARVDKKDTLPQLRSTSGRVKIYEDAGATTQAARENPFECNRVSSVFLPGFSKDGRYAVVRLGFPWSIHSGEATYILERTNAGWKVLLRDFIYYL
jgi:hypothetical protein